MRYTPRSPLPLLTLAASSTASIIPNTVVQYSDPTWIENIAATRNGSLLASILTAPEVRLINPFTEPATSTLVSSIPDAFSTLGLAEYEPDRWAVIAASYNAFAGQLPQGSSIWSIDLRNGNPSTAKLADLPESQLLNGMVALNKRTLLMSDSFAGHIVKLDLVTKKAEVVIDHPSMKPSAPMKTAVNGLKLVNDYLYYTNTEANTVTRVRINGETGAAIGTFETVTSSAAGADDLLVAPDGTTYVALNFLNEFARVERNGEITTLAGNLNSSLVPGPTAAAFGRTHHDSGTIYVSTTGGAGAKINGTFEEGGKVLAFKLW